MQHRGKPAEVAHPDRIIEPEFRPQGGRHLGRDIWVARKFPKRVAGGEREYRKQDNADPEEARDCNQQAPEKVPAHHLCWYGADHVSRHQSFKSQKSLSQPLSVALSLCDIAATQRRFTIGMTTWSPITRSFILMISAARLTGSSSLSDARYASSYSSL